MIASVHGTVDGLVLVGLGEGFIMGIGYVIAGVPHPALLERPPPSRPWFRSARRSRSGSRR